MSRSLNKAYLTMSKYQGTSNRFQYLNTRQIDETQNPKFAECKQQWKVYQQVSGTMGTLHLQQKEMNDYTSCRMSSITKETSVKRKSLNMKSVFEN